MKLSLIIPVYNEAPTLKAIWETLHKIQWPTPVEYILIDDGSTDASVEIAKSLVGQGDQLIIQEKNQGKTAAVKAGIAASTGDILVVQDADMEYDPQDIVRLMKPIMEEKADVVFGSRYKQTGDQIQRTYHRLGIRVLTMFSNLCTGIYLTDLEGCYKVWRADLLKNIEVDTSGFDFDPEVTAKIAKLRVRMHESHISYYPRAYVEGKKIRMSDGLTAVWTLVRYSFLKSFKKCFKPTLPSRYLFPGQSL